MQIDPFAYRFFLHFKEVKTALSFKTHLTHTGGHLDRFKAADKSIVAKGVVYAV